MVQLEQKIKDMQNEFKTLAHDAKLGQIMQRKMTGASVPTNIQVHKSSMSQPKSPVIRTQPSLIQQVNVAPLNNTEGT